MFILKKDLVETHQMSPTIALKICIILGKRFEYLRFTRKTLTETPVLTQNVIHNFLNNSQEYKFSAN